MKDIVPIRDEATYDDAIAEVRRLWGAEPDTDEGNRLDVLMVLVEDYENRNHAIEPPDPIEAIQIRMEAMALQRADLGKMLGVSSGRLSEILNRRRRLTIDMMRVLAAELKLSESCLLKPYELVPPSTSPPVRQAAHKQRKGRMAA
jgi:HTH-type transcriptional regulator/antitoxin HigA